MMHRTRGIVLIAVSHLVMILVTDQAHAQVAEFTSFSQWQASAGPYTTITFGEFPDGTLITTQYTPLGVTFTDGLDFIYMPPSPLFPEDGAGLDGVNDIDITFATPQYWIGAHYPGALAFELHSAGNLIYTSSIFGIGGTGFFAGLVSSQPFDAVTIRDPFLGAVIDNLYFGVPGPGALPLLALAGVWRTSRRRW